MNLTAAAEADSAKFDGIDLFLSAPHVDIDSTDDDVKALAEEVDALNLKIGSVVAPVWEPTGGGSAMGGAEERGRFLTQVRNACHIAKTMRELGVRPTGIVRVDSSVDPEHLGSRSGGEHGTDCFDVPRSLRHSGGLRRNAGSRRRDKEICWGGMHGWKTMINTL